MLEELTPDKQAILLTNNNTDTAWFHAAAQKAAAICFTRGRINFYKADVPKTSPTNGQVFFYFGKNEEQFILKFKEIGLILKTYDYISQKI